MVGRGRRDRLLTDAVREVRNTCSRFLSILILSALAVAFLSGLRAAAPDMQYTADRYFDRTHMMDGYVISTLGLTDEDLEALAASPGVEDVEGIWSVDAVARDIIVSVRSMPQRLNLLELTEGRFPEAADECVTERMLLVELGLQIGDRLELTLDEDNEGDLACLSYTITGVATSPLYVGTDRGTSSLGSGSVDAFMYVPGENFRYDYYTMAYFTGDGLEAMNSYDEEYDSRLETLVDSLDGLADERALIRYTSVVNDAQSEIDDARKELDDAKGKLADARTDADRELADAWMELTDARKELDDGWNDYQEGIRTYHEKIRDGERELADALQELTDGEAELADGRKEYEDGLADYQDALLKYENSSLRYQDGKTEYEDGQRQYADGKDAYERGLSEYQSGERQYEEGLAQYQNGLAAFQQKKGFLEAGKAELDSNITDYENTLSFLNDSQQKLDEQKDVLAGQQAEYDEKRAAFEQMDQSDSRYEDWRTQLEAAKEQLDVASSSVAEKQQELDIGRGQAQMAKGKIDAAQAELDAGYAQLPGAQAELEATENLLRGSRQQLDAAQAEVRSSKWELDSAKEDLSDALRELEEAEYQLGEGRKELDDAWKELEDARQEIEDGQKELTDGWNEYHDGEAELEQARADGQKELDDALAELRDGEQEYADGLTEYEDGREEADREIADAQKELDDAQIQVDDAQAELDQVEECQWYVLGRNTNMGFEGYGQDSERIGNLAHIFPVIFFLVAALACLTTMTRMVEEQRTQIGALKAMGFSRLAISKKYIGYALAASLTGGVLGLGLGVFLIPEVIANAFNILYDIPPLQFKRQAFMCAASVLAAVFCTTGAALWACLSTLVDTPANLMRPRTPKPGKRVFLERIRPLWRSLSFTWKVTMRNLFRYKRRFWMTVIGIGGCTALIVTGFGLHDSIFSILDRQFDEISLYDATVGLDGEAASDKREAVEEYLSADPAVERFLVSSLSMAQASAEGPAYDVNLFAVDQAEDFARFVDLRHRLDGEKVVLPEKGAVITEKLSELLGIGVGESIVLEKDGRRSQAQVTDIAENYVQHYVYLSGGYYEELFGEEPEKNAVLLKYRDGAGQDQSDRVSAGLMAMEGVLSYSYIATVRDSFTNSMVAIDYAVIIIIIAAAALAFVVLYNLTNINITERTRELATLKVLGFYDRETTAYVYRENVFLTVFGILLGLVLGRFLHSWLVLTVEVSRVMFGRTAPGYAYALAAALTAVFSVIVNVAAHFKLKKVDMVESLKTVE